jgi:hypothetical protein
MKQTYLQVGLLSAMSFIWQPVHAHTATLYFDYVATNADIGQGGSIAQGTKGQYNEVAILTITDLSDLKAGSGVRVTLSNQHSTDIFGRNASAATVIGSFELNFPNTASTATDFNNNYANWGNNSGVPMAFSTNPDNGGVEWQEDGCTTAAISGSCAAENSSRIKWDGWGQQFNYGGSAGTNVDKNNKLIAFTQGLTSTFDMYNAATGDDISALKLLANPISASDAPLQTVAFGWLNAISGVPNSADPNNRAVAASGWWGNSVNSTLMTSTNNRVQVIATHYSLDNGPLVSTSVHVECLFNAIENDTRYQSYLQPKGFVSSIYQSFVYRYYPQSNSYLGVSSDDNHLYYLVGGGKMLDLTQTFGWDLQTKLAEYNCR